MRDYTLIIIKTFRKTNWIKLKLSKTHCQNKFDDLDKAQGAHAEKQVQVTAKNAKELFAAHLRLFAELLVRRAVVAQRELHKRRVHVLGHVVDANLIE